jgi:hypothetical protein
MDAPLKTPVLMFLKTTNFNLEVVSSVLDAYMCKECGDIRQD